MGALVANGHMSNPRYLPKPLPAAPLVVRCRYLAVVSRPLPAAPLMYLIVVYRPLPAAPRELPAAPLVVRRRYLIVLPRPMLTAPLKYSTWPWCSRLYPRRRSLCVTGGNLIVVPKPLLAAPLVVCRRCPGRCPRRRDAVAAGDKQLGRCAAEQSQYYRLYLYSRNVTLAATYLRRVRVISRSSAAALTHVSTVVTPPAPAAK